MQILQLNSLRIGVIRKSLADVPRACSHSGEESPPPASRTSVLDSTVEHRAATPQIIRVAAHAAGHARNTDPHARTYASDVFGRYCLAAADVLALVRRRLGARLFAVAGVIDDVLDLHEQHAVHLLAGRPEGFAGIPDELAHQAVAMRSAVDGLVQPHKLLEMLPSVIWMLAKASRAANEDVMQRLFAASWEGRLAAACRRVARATEARRIDDLLWRAWLRRALRKVARIQAEAAGRTQRTLAAPAVRPALLLEGSGRILELAAGRHLILAGSAGNAG